MVWVSTFYVVRALWKLHMSCLSRLGRQGRLLQGHSNGMHTAFLAGLMAKQQMHLDAFSMIVCIVHAL
jgi:hypothetical protein